MGLKRSLAAMATLACVYFGALPGAASVTLDEYDRMNSVEKDRLMFTVLHFYYYRFSDDPDTVEKAHCMRDLNDRTVGDGEPYLASLITDELETVRGASGSRPTVEAVVKDVIDRECEAS